MPGWLSSLLGVFAAAFLDSLAQAIRGTRFDEAAAQTSKDLGASEATNATLQTISDIAATRADLPRASSDAGELSRRLRERAELDRHAISGAPVSGGGVPGTSG